MDIILVMSEAASAGLAFVELGSVAVSAITQAAAAEPALGPLGEVTLELSS